MITGAQCRAGRALAELTREMLAKLSRVDATVIEHFERKLDKPDDGTIKVIADALEGAGVVFIPENGGGVGVRLKFTASEAKRIATLENEGGAIGLDDVQQ